jgi:hypothetical protein
MSLSLLFLFTRGPHEHRWLGWRGGASLRKKRVLGDDAGPDAVTEGRAAGIAVPRGADVEHKAGAGADPAPESGDGMSYSKEGDVGMGDLDSDREKAREGVDDAEGQPVPMPLIQGTEAVKAASEPTFKGG